MTCDLRFCLQGTAWDWSSKLHKAVIHKLLEALDRIHEAGVLHGDLHKRNILVTPSRKVFILDFDGCRLHASEKRRKAESAQMAEHLQHMVSLTTAISNEPAITHLRDPSDCRMPWAHPSAWQPSVILCSSSGVMLAPAQVRMHSPPPVRARKRRVRRSDQ